MNEIETQEINKTEITSEVILDALMMLHIKYSKEQMSVDCHCHPNGEIRFRACVQGVDYKNFTCSDLSKTPLEAVQQLIDRAGNREPEDLRRKEINELREKLRKLEEEGQKGKI